MKLEEKSFYAIHMEELVWTRTVALIVQQIRILFLSQTQKISVWTLLRVKKVLSPQYRLQTLLGFEQPPFFLDQWLVLVG